MTEFSDLKGLILKSITPNEDKDEIIFVTSDDRTFKMYHSQDCCESVSIEDIAGDLNDLLGSPLFVAEEATSNVNPENANPATIEYQDSFTWTFYKLATIKGHVDIRWYGESNGYYSESVDFYEVQ